MNVWKKEKKIFKKQQHKNINMKEKENKPRRVDTPLKSINQ